MDAGLISTLAVAITGGSTLGATIAGFFAYRQKSLVTFLRESNQDYKDRVEQLESDRDRFEKLAKDQADEIAQMKAEKRLPLENLTALITSQHSALVDAITGLTNALAQQQPNAPRRKSK
jgi:predicted PurR-regulated permease PerM